MRQFNSVPDYYSEEEALALYSNYQERYLAQLPNTRMPLYSIAHAWAIFPD